VDDGAADAVFLGKVGQGYFAVRVAAAEVFYTDHALDDPDCFAIIEEACAGHPYTPDVPFNGDLFEVFEGKAQQVKKNDQVATAHATLWKLLRRWCVDTVDRARLVRHEIEREVDVLDNPTRKPCIGRFAVSTTTSCGWSSPTGTPDPGRPERFGT
jgi:hypothetical protein